VKAVSIADTWATASHEPLFRCAQHNHKCEHLSKNIRRVPAQFITRSQESLPDNSRLSQYSRESYRSVDLEGHGARDGPVILTDCDTRHVFTSAQLCAGNPGEVWKFVLLRAGGIEATTFGYAVADLVGEGQSRVCDRLAVMEDVQIELGATFRGSG
jgi:hypothetical protein